MSFPEQGYLFAFFGKQYREEAIRSAKRIKVVDRDAHITAVTTEEEDFEDAFDHVVFRKFSSGTYQRHLLYKVLHMYRCSPYQRTLFLDSDTYLCYAVPELFDLLDHFDVGVTHGPYDTSIPKLYDREVVGYWPFNTGVITFSKNAVNERVFDLWSTLYEDHVNGPDEYGIDQEFLNTALLRYSARVCTLPVQYNARVHRPLCFVPPLKILHAHADLPNIAARVNSLMKRIVVWKPDGSIS